MTGCNFGKADIYYILTVWQIEGGKPFDISRSSGVICRAGMWNSVGFDIRGGRKDHCPSAETGIPPPAAPDRSDLLGNAFCPPRKALY